MHSHDSFRYIDNFKAWDFQNNGNGTDSRTTRVIAAVHTCHMPNAPSCPSHFQPRSQPPLYVFGLFQIEHHPLFFITSKKTILNTPNIPVPSPEENFVLTQKMTSSTIKKMAFIGQELKRERELRGISLQEIADATKINIRHLRDLEEERLDNLPGKFFIKGIIRSYAKYIGLDEFAVLNSYYESELYRDKVDATSEEEKTEDFSLPTRFKRTLFSVSLLLILMAVLTAVYLFVYRRPEVQEPVQITLPQAAVKEEIPEIQAPLPEAEEQELVLDLSFRLETWLQVYADGMIVVDGTKMPGESVQVKAKKELLIHTGNAGGMIFYLNENKGISLGSDWAVVRDIRITFDNMEEFIEKDDKNLSF